MWGKRTRERLARIEAALERVEGRQAAHSDALDVATPGGLGAVMSVARDAKTAAESAFVGVQTLASQATAKPGIPEVVKAVSAHTDALRAMEATVRTATGPQPVLDAAPVPVVPVKGMGARVPPKTPGKM